MKSINYENFPLGIVVLSGTIGISIYIIGACILAGFGILFPIFYRAEKGQFSMVEIGY